MVWVLDSLLPFVVLMSQNVNASQRLLLLLNDLLQGLKFQCESIKAENQEFQVVGCCRRLTKLPVGPGVEIHLLTALLNPSRTSVVTKDQMWAKTFPLVPKAQKEMGRVQKNIQSN